MTIKREKIVIKYKVCYSQSGQQDFLPPASQSMSLVQAKYTCIGAASHKEHKTNYVRPSFSLLCLILEEDMKVTDIFTSVTINGLPDPINNKIKFH